MLKLLVKKALERFGYQIVQSRDAPPNPFAEMRRLVGDSTPAPVIFDVGAHHGLASLHYRQVFPKAVIYAFEPFPESYEQLRKNTAADSLIQTFNFGFSDFEGEKSFCVNAASATNSLLETDDRGRETWGDGLLETTRRVSLPFSTIDGFAAKMRIPTVDILKLDVQGSEFLVLKGARRLMASSQIKLIYSEIILQPTYRNQKEVHEVLALFRDYGFWLHSFYDLSRTNDGRLRQMDAIFTKTAP